ncbi:MAG: DUF1207 domain-containing protein [Acidobacteriota bacterium]
MPRTLGTLARTCLALLLIAPSASAKWKPNGPFEHRPLYNPLAAEPRSAQMKVLFPGRSSSFPYAVNSGQGAAWDISVGDEIPLITFATSSALAAGEGAPQRGLAVGLAFPLSFHMIEDMGNDESNPILNTDYRFGLMLKAQYGLPSTWGIVHDGHIGLRFVPIAHESTHLGDEFTLHATQKYGNTFRRVNVSYQYWELAGSFEPNFLKDGRLRMKARGGVIHEAFNSGKGWYSTELIQPIGGTVHAVKEELRTLRGIRTVPPRLAVGRTGDPSSPSTSVIAPFTVMTAPRAPSQKPRSYP